MWNCSGHLCWEKALMSRLLRKKQSYNIQRWKHRWLLSFTCSSLGHMCNAALFSGWILKTLTTGVASNVFCGGFIPIAQTKTPTPTDNLALTLQTKNGRFWEMSCKKNEWLGSSCYFCPGDLVVEEVEASVRMPWHLKRMWTSVWDLGDDLLRMDLILGLRNPWELSGKIVITISVGALHEPSWFMIHCYTAAAGPKISWGFGSILSRMPVANEGLGWDSWALTCTSPGGDCYGVGWG